ncbi:subtilase family protease [Leptolyngbya sp. Heron Island J]|uniref:S8 family serine peptidase n=1 Tax=Leptolyngbya sp. Heron Island J TaxID=1385935 RepID=UPI0003B97E07|nr:S8 family serine peptidase [Leptolyngbya sp. Heron Island J]ESA34967.1 subtilase family protease [Leptolyngbya sp. Heron Island J]
MRHWLLPITAELSNDLSLDLLASLFDVFDNTSAERNYLSSLVGQLAAAVRGELSQPLVADSAINDVAALLGAAVDLNDGDDLPTPEALIEELVTLLLAGDLSAVEELLDVGLSVPEIEMLPATAQDGFTLNDLFLGHQAFADHQLVQTLGMPLAALSPDFSMEGLGNDAIAFANNIISTAADSLQTYGDGVIIDAIAHRDPQQLLADLENLGFAGSAFGDTVSGWLPLTSISALADLENLRSARPTYAINRVGQVTSEANPALAADIARDLFDVDGTDITVGILSDSFSASVGANGSYAEDIASGDLPDDVAIVADISSGSDEGRAMAQLIHDLAPGADLAFRTAFRGAADFANGILELVAIGADVIVDDIGYLDQPFFQDGVIAQAVDQAVAAGVPYFSAAGNSGANSYEDEFRFGLQIGNYRLHDFAADDVLDIFQSFTLAPGEGITLSFQWDQPFSSSGGSGSTNDLDIFVFDNPDLTTGNIVATSVEDNISSGNAFEFLNFVNDTGSTQDFHIVIGRNLMQGGTDPGRIKYIDFDGQASDVEYATNSSTSFGHPNAAGAAAVGAAFYADTPAFGTVLPRLESFSSLGGTEIFFDTDGNRLDMPELRQTVDFVAVDGTNTTFFGTDIGDDSGAFPNFFGTSAAAPHAAAVAVLMLEAANNAGLDPTPQDIYTALESTALDMDNPFTEQFDLGYDPASGFGLIQADAAIDALLNNLSPSGEILEGTDNRDVLVGTPEDDMIIGFGARDLLVGGTGSDQFFYTSPDDGVDYVLDFEVRVDQVVLTTLLDSLGYTGTTPFVDGYLDILPRSINSSAILRLDTNGGGDELRRFIQFHDVTPTELADINNFVV